ncbi:MAG TPA: trypsin-like serine protease [Nodularia sp. (in: cyanobacteria)]|nr:trypsin-like serine protease [Nodularia sp. (in: cyanobacteria)]
MHKSIAVFNISVLATSLAISQTPIFAQQAELSTQDLIKEAPAASINSTQTFWTPENLSNAKPLSLPLSYNGVVTGQTSEVTGKAQSSPGARPKVEISINQQPLFRPNELEVQSQKVQPHNRGTKDAYFTSSQLLPLSNDTSYPYTTTGKLFFTKPGVGNFVCSASVVRPRIIMTAGHCVHSGSGGADGFYNNFLFIPAYRDGAAPYEQWSWSRVIVTGSWSNGGGGVPNSADYAIIELSDKEFNGVTRKIGEVVGYLGYRTLSLLPNHVTMLGYPVNLNNGQKMHQVTAGSYGDGGNNTGVYGSDMRGGSSGGPWVQNFGVAASGQVDGLNTNPNQIVGVTSYGSTEVGPLYIGSSILDDQFIRILNTACNWQSGNC